jgi:hypothetical protein
MQRTVKVRLTVNAAQAQTLTQTVTILTDCFNIITAHGWEHHTDNGVELHKATTRRKAEA